MGNPLPYLLLTKLKNKIKSFFRSPGKIIYLVVLIGMVGASIVGGSSANMDGRTFRDIHELAAVITLFYSVMFVMMAYKGFGNGASMFTMSDVNFIFPAPFLQRKVLFYGLFQQIGTSLLLGFFLLFQYAWLRSTFNINYGTLLLIVLGYAVTVFFAQIAAMVLYSFTSADDHKKRLIKIVFFTIVAAFLAYIAVNVIGDKYQLLTRVVEVFNGTIVGLFPVSGWIGHAVSGILLGSVWQVVFGALLCIVFLIGLVCLITYGNQDFYEDVLKSTEITQSAITARKEGHVGDAAPSRVRLGKTGIGKGFGASVFYSKHMLENRRSRVFILEPMRLTFAVITIALAFFTRDLGISVVFSTATIFQIFTVALGRFTKELTKPYIYLIPEPPLKKMLYALAEALPSSIVETLIIFVPVAFILGAGPLDILLCMAARLSYAFLFTAVNVAVDRIWGGGSEKTLLMLLYFAILIAMAIPGIILAALLSTQNPEVMQNMTIFLSLIVCNIPISLIALYLCRNMLQYAELNQR